MDTRIDVMLQGGQFKRLLEEQSMELRDKYGLKRAELEILYYLSHCGNQNTSSDIHRTLMMNRGHISQAVDQLCRKKYIVAIPDNDDRRYVHYETTEQAVELIDELTRRREEIHNRILKGISASELETFRRVFEKISENMKEIK